LLISRAGNQLFRKRDDPGSIYNYVGGPALRRWAHRLFQLTRGSFVEGRWFNSDPRNHGR